MNRTIRFACAGLFAGTTTCSLIFSASATMAKAASVHVPAGVVWSAVGFLELLSLAGTLRWLTASTPAGRTHAIVVVALAAAVTAQFGWSFYGWVGALAPVAVVLTLHMIDETLRDTSGPGHNLRSEEPLAKDAPISLAAAPQAPPQLRSVGWSVDDIVADLRERGMLDAHQRYIRNQYSVGPGKANKVLAELQLVAS